MDVSSDGFSVVSGDAFVSAVQTQRLGRRTRRGCSPVEDMIEASSRRNASRARHVRPIPEVAGVVKGRVPFSYSGGDGAACGLGCMAMPSRGQSCRRGPWLVRATGPSGSTIRSTRRICRRSRRAWSVGDRWAARSGSRRSRPAWTWTTRCATKDGRRRPPRRKTSCVRRSCPL
jgi:hypothetical protein